MKRLKIKPKIFIMAQIGLLLLTSRDVSRSQPQPLRSPTHKPIESCEATARQRYVRRQEAAGFYYGSDVVTANLSISAIWYLLWHHSDYGVIRVRHL